MQNDLILILLNFYKSKKITIFFKSIKNNYFLLTLSNTFLLYMFLHFRLSHFFFFSQINDLLSWQILPKSTKPKITINYNLNLWKGKNNLNFSIIVKKTIFSKNNLFFNLTWLERELREMNNISIKNQVDKRNLLLNYSATNAPLLKNLPSWGEDDLFYSNLEESCVFRKITIQL